MSNKELDSYLTELGVTVHIQPAVRQSCPDRCTEYVGNFRNGKYEKRVKLAHNHGHRYEMVLKRDGRSALQLGDWWNSITSRWMITPLGALIERKDTHIASMPDAYDMLSAYRFFTNHETFESWCSDMGADNDSIKAHTAYIEECKVAILFQRMFTNEELEHLSELAS